MDNGKKFNKKILPSNNIIQTLMKVSQLHSSSSSLSFQSNNSSGLNNKNINYQKLHYISRKLSIKNNKKLSTINDKTLNAARKKLLQLEWNNYIQWRILLTFSLVLWILLCITDKILLKSSSSSSKEEKIQKVPQSIYELNENKLSKWFSALYSSIYNTTIVLNSTEAYTFALFIGIFICMETKLRKKIKNTRDNSTQYSNDLTQIQSLDFNKNKLAIELFENKFQDGKNLNILSEDKFNIKNLEFKQLIIDPDLYWQLKMPDNIREITCNIKNPTDNYLNQLEIINEVKVKEIDDKNINHLNKLNKCYCDNDNKSFVETYDLEISKLMYKKKELITFDKSTDTQLDKIKFKKSATKNSIIKLKNNCNKINRVSIKNDRVTNKFISSSPAFKKFLLKLNDSNPLDSILNL